MKYIVVVITFLRCCSAMGMTITGTSITGVDIVNPTTVSVTTTAEGEWHDGLLGFNIRGWGHNDYDAQPGIFMRGGGIWNSTTDTVSTQGRLLDKDVLGTCFLNYPAGAILDSSEIDGGDVSSLNFKWHDATASLEDLEFGIDQFVQTCDYLGDTPVFGIPIYDPNLAINAADTGPEENAQFVTYLKTTQSYPTEDYYFIVGCEPVAAHTEITAAQYVTAFNDIYDSIAEVQATPRVGAWINYTLRDTKPTWNSVVFTGTSSKATFYATHIYGHADGIATYVDDIYDSVGGTDPCVMISEWNTVNETSEATAQSWDQAVDVARYLGEFGAVGDKIICAMYWNATNSTDGDEWGLFKDDGTASPAYTAFDVWNNMYEGAMYNITGLPANVYGYASKSGSYCSLIFVNDGTADVGIAISGITVPDTFSVYTSATPTAVNYNSYITIPANSFAFGSTF